VKIDLKGYDLIIPVFNEGKKIIKLIEYITLSSKFLKNIYICYDYNEDSSIFEIKKSKFVNKKNIILLKNNNLGPCEAIKTGFKNSKSKAVIIYPADDFYNGLLLDEMYKLSLNGYDVVCPSRFIKGGTIKNCPLIKYLILKIVAITLFYFTNLNIKDPTNGFRLFSKNLLKKINVDSTQGFAYSLEILIKAKRLKLNIAEIPSTWIERKSGKSNFKLLKWSGAYLKWYFLAFFSFIL